MESSPRGWYLVGIVPIHSNGINILLVKQGASSSVYKNQAGGSLLGMLTWRPQQHFSYTTQKAVQAYFSAWKRIPLLHWAGGSENLIHPQFLISSLAWSVCQVVRGISCFSSLHDHRIVAPCIYMHTNECIRHLLQLHILVVASRLKYMNLTIEYSYSMVPLHVCLCLSKHYTMYHKCGCSYSLIPWPSPACETFTCCKWSKLEAWEQILTKFNFHHTSSASMY